MPSRKAPTTAQNLKVQPQRTSQLDVIPQRFVSRSPSAMAVCEVPLISPLTEGIDELVKTSHGHRPFPHQALNRADRAVPSERRSDDSTVETDIEVY